MSIYHFLPKSSIRLLKVLPDKDKGLLVCTIQHFGENDVPSYVALSYLWGNATHTKHILIYHMDGKRPHFQGIQSSLWEFLDQVYHDQMNNMAKSRDYYWTDLLCLDQTSHLEMQQQLPRMGTIYSEASRTIAWLGRAPKTQVQTSGKTWRKTSLGWGIGSKNMERLLKHSSPNNRHPRDPRATQLYL